MLELKPIKSILSRYWLYYKIFLTMRVMYVEFFHVMTWLLFNKSNSSYVSVFVALSKDNPLAIMFFPEF